MAEIVITAIVGTMLSTGLLLRLMAWSKLRYDGPLYDKWASIHNLEQIAAKMAPAPALAAFSVAPAIRPLLRFPNPSNTRFAIGYTANLATIESVYNVGSQYLAQGWEDR